MRLTPDCPLQANPHTYNIFHTEKEKAKALLHSDVITMSKFTL